MEVGPNLLEDLLWTKSAVMGPFKLKIAKHNAHLTLLHNININVLLVIAEYS